jgi:hypothetical protein
MTTPVRTVKLVRLREGVFATGDEVGDNSPPPRVPHLVDVTVDMESPKRITTCCGLEFAPHTLEEVPWIELLPHAVCLRRSSWPRREIEAEFSEARDIEHRLVPKMDGDDW